MTLTKSTTGQRDWKTAGAALLMLVSGIIHFFIVPHHWEHAPAHGIAMGMIGVLEVTWAVAYWLRPSRRLAQIGVMLAISLISLWTITRFAPAPFTNEAEEVDFPGVLTKTLEAVTAVTQLALVERTTPEAGSGRWRQNIITAVFLSVLLAVGVYEVGRAAQPLFPQLSSPALEHQDDH